MIIQQNPANSPSWAEDQDLDPKISSQDLTKSFAAARNHNQKPLFPPSKKGDNCAQTWMLDDLQHSHAQCKIQNMTTRHIVEQQTKAIEALQK